jgi:hypothetical protein
MKPGMVTHVCQPSVQKAEAWTGGMAQVVEHKTLSSKLPGNNNNKMLKEGEAGRF